MSEGAADTANPPTARRGGSKILLGVVKILITGACFWYLSRQIDASAMVAGIAHMDLRWIGLATLFLMLEIPLVAMRWRAIVNAIARPGWRAAPGNMIAIAAISAFFSQILPGIAGEGIRSWLLVRLRCGWRTGITSVVVDRAVGVGLLLVLTLLILQLPSGLSALGGFREMVFGVYGACVLAAALALLFLPNVIPLLARLRYLRWAADLLESVRRVLFGRSAAVVLGLALIVHALTILGIWCVGRAQGLTLPLSDAAVLFVVVLGVALIPISIGGWGVRELAVVTVLGRHGLAAEQALLFSVCFGVVLALSALPGGIVWIFYTGAADKAAVSA
jgi:glycosyltransferase 2 family protein